MRTGMGLVLIGIGAIFAFAVTRNTPVLNLHTAGYVIIVVGILGLAIPRRGYGWVRRRLFVRQARWRPRSRITEVTYPADVIRSPADTRVHATVPTPVPLGSREAAGHAAAGSDLSTEPYPGETVIVEDVYDE